MKIEEYISELLFEHDCVIVPDFGGFICNYASARIDPVKHLFEPPGKKILFNKGLTRNDGLLAHHISGKLNLSYSEALNAIAKEVKRYKEALEKNRRLTLDSVGLFYTDETGNILFQQDKRLNYLGDSFGLSVFYHLPVEQTNAGNDAKVIPIYNERKKDRIYAVAGVLIVLVASTFVFTLIGKKNNMNFSSLNFFSQKEASQYVFSPYKELPKPVNEPAVNITPSKAVTPVSAPASFSIIVGSFSVKENADNLINEYSKQNIHLSIIDRNPQGLYVVGYGKFTSHDAAAAERDSFRKRFVKDAWIKAM